MPKIVVKKKAEVVKELPIPPFQSKVNVGSEGDNDLVLTDKKVSLHHLQIEKDENDYYVMDKDSAFGSFINGMKIDSRTLLKSGDVISIGEFSLVFEDQSREKNGEAKPDNNEIDAVEDDAPSPESGEDNGEAVEETVVAETKVDEDEDSSPAKDKPVIQGEMPHFLVGIYGPYTGKKFQLNSGVTKIGRDRSLNDIVIRENGKGETDSSISRRHATITKENGDFYIYDKRSKTRTYVNREKLDEKAVLKLEMNDEIEIVSDQKSTIFRFVEDGMWDYSEPRRAGTWWIRNGSNFIKAVSALLVLLLIFALIGSWRKAALIRQKPSSLKVNETLWFTENKPMEVFNQPEQIARLMYTLTPAIGDYNGDGVNDVAYLDKVGYLYMKDGETNQFIWPQNEKYRIQIPLQMLSCDMNGNGLPDIVLPAVNSRIYAIDGKSGYEIWTSPILEGDYSGAPVVAEINGDSFKDVLCCTRNGKIYVGYGTINEPNWVVHEVMSEIRSTPSAGDLDNDGIDEVVFGTENGEIFVFNGKTNEFTHRHDLNEEMQKAKGSFYEDHQIRGNAVLGHLDGDGHEDIVVTTLQGAVIALSGKTFKRLWYDEYLTEDPFSVKLLMPAALGDFDGDSKQDVVVYSFENKIVAYKGEGNTGSQKEILWNYMPQAYEIFAAHPVVVDMNKDGFSDVIIAGLYGGLAVLDGMSGKVMWEHPDNVNLEEALVSTPLIADMHRDGELDIVARGANGRFYVAETNIRVEKSSLLWNQLNHDAGNSANFKLSTAGVSGYIVSSLIYILLIAGVVLTNVYLILKRKRLFSSE